MDDQQTPGTAQDGIDAVRNGWFTELSTMWPGQGLSFRIEEELFRGRSKFQVRRRAHTHTVATPHRTWQSSAPRHSGVCSSSTVRTWCVLRAPSPPQA